MVFGPDLMANVERLATIVDHVEVVLFWTQELHNIPSKSQAKRLADLVDKHALGCSVHLPASFQIASENPRLREWSAAKIADIVRRTAFIRPQHYILHIPFTKPTLTPVPGLYFSETDSDRFVAWTGRARKSLQALCSTIGPRNRLLVENINYSPSFLMPFCREGLCGLCLDIGHLMLGSEAVGEALENFLPAVEEIHLHGVRGWEEHLALDVLEPARLAGWAAKLQKHGFDGVVDIEVFCQEDLTASIAALIQVLLGRNRAAC